MEKDEDPPELPTRADYWSGLAVDALIELCQDGNLRACEELDARGVEAPVIEPDAPPVAKHSTLEGAFLAAGLRAEDIDWSTLKIVDGGFK